MSRVGAIIHKDDIPLSKNTIDSAKKVGKDPYDFALSGGEDFELIFTVPKKDQKRIHIDCPLTVVGEVMEQKHGSMIESNGKKAHLSGGYDHFS
jgi:thiamine-monophosphate kinase